MRSKFKAVKYFLLLFFVSSVFFSFINPDAKIQSSAGNNYFKMPDGFTETDYMSNTVIVKLKEKNRNLAGLDRLFIPSVNKTLGDLNAGLVKIFPDAVKPVQEFSQSGEKYSDLSLIYVVKYNSSVSVEEAVNELYATGEFEYAQPKYIQKTCFTPNDPSLGSQYFINKIQAPAGWDIQRGDTNVVIGIVDTGTDWDHPDLAANIKHNYADPINGVDDDADGYVDNFRGWDFGGADYTNVVADNNPMCSGSNTNHGSHVSGDASAVTDNGVGVSGPGFRCKILGVKTAADNDTRGAGGTALIISGYEGIKYAADKGCAVINCSWGGTGGGQFEQDVITYATINKNALVVCSAGNNSSSGNFFPAGYKYVLNVASTNSSDLKSGFSNFGNNIDVCAPGSGIYSTLYNNSYASFDGTSMSSPVTAGTCAIVKSQFPAYTAMQVGEKVRVTCDNIDGINPSYAGKLGKGRINMQRALTVNSPAVRITSYTITDGNNNVPQPNDTVYIVGTFRNYLDATSNCNVQVTTTSTAVSILNASSTLGAIPTLGTATNSTSPFRVRVNGTAPTNSIVEFKVNYTDGSYTDFEYFSVVINPSYFSMGINKIATTINSKGHFGFNDFPNNTQGIGFKYNNGENLTFEGALMCAVSSAKVSDVARSSTGSTQNNDFTSIIPFQITEPGVISNQDGNSKFNDDGAGVSKIGIEVNFSCYEFITPVDEDYIMMKYRIKNTTASTVTNFYAGLFSDWDIGVNGALNRADWDAVNQLGYVWRTDNNPSSYAGITLLSAPNAQYWAIDNEQNISGNPWNIYDGFTDTEKFQSLSSGVGRQQAGGTTGRDVSHVVGSGPYSIPAGGEISIVFAVLAGDNLNDLKANAIAAKNKYNTLLSVVNYNSEIPQSFSLSQNYPNPFNPGTSIKFGIPATGNVSLKVFDISGKLVEEIVNGVMNAGSYDVNFDGSRLSSGVYFYKLQSEGFVETKRMMLIK